MYSKKNNKSDLRWAETIHHGDEQEEKEEPANNIKSEIVGSNGNTFIYANNGEII